MSSMTDNKPVDDGGAATGWRAFADGGPALERVIVAGWQPRHGTVDGYWWYHEDYTDDTGVPMDYPGALLFVRMVDVLPPFPACQEQSR